MTQCNTFFLFSCILLLLHIPSSKEKLSAVIGATTDVNQNEETTYVFSVVIDPIITEHEILTIKNSNNAEVDFLDVFSNQLCPFSSIFHTSTSTVTCSFPQIDSDTGSIKAYIPSGSSKFSVSVPENGIKRDSSIAFVIELDSYSTTVAESGIFLKGEATFSYNVVDNYKLEFTIATDTGGPSFTADTLDISGTNFVTCNTPCSSSIAISGTTVTDCDCSTAGTIHITASVSISSSPTTITLTDVNPDLHDENCSMVITATGSTLGGKSIYQPYSRPFKTISASLTKRVKEMTKDTAVITLESYQDIPSGSLMIFTFPNSDASEATYSQTVNAQHILSTVSEIHLEVSQTIKHYDEDQSTYSQIVFTFVDITLPDGDFQVEVKIKPFQDSIDTYLFETFIPASVPLCEKVEYSETQSECVLYDCSEYRGCETCETATATTCRTCYERFHLVDGTHCESNIDAHCLVADETDPNLCTTDKCDAGGFLLSSNNYCERNGKYVLMGLSDAFPQDLEEGENPILFFSLVLDEPITSEKNLIITMSSIKDNLLPNAEVGETSLTTTCGFYSIASEASYVDCTIDKTAGTLTATLPISTHLFILMMPDDSSGVMDEDKDFSATLSDYSFSNYKIRYRYMILSEGSFEANSDGISYDISIDLTAYDEITSGSKIIISYLKFETHTPGDCSSSLESESLVSPTCAILSNEMIEITGINSLQNYGETISFTLKNVDPTSLATNLPPEIEILNEDNLQVGLGYIFLMNIPLKQATVELVNYARGTSSTYNFAITSHIKIPAQAVIIIQSDTLDKENIDFTDDSNLEFITDLVPTDEIRIKAITEIDANIEKTITVDGLLSPDDDSVTFSFQILANYNQDVEILYMQTFYPTTTNLCNIGEYSADLGQTCEACDVGCETCDSGSTACLSCSESYRLEYSETDSKDICVECTVSSPNCKTCSLNTDDAEICTECYEKFRVTSDYLCESCDHTLCLSCTSQKNICTECEAPLIVDSETCGCEDGYYSKYDDVSLLYSCQPCGVENCLKCYESEEICDKCADGYTVSEAGESCVETVCEDGQYLDGNVCEECTVSNCALCPDGEGTCGTCLDSYALNTTTTPHRCTLIEEEETEEEEAEEEESEEEELNSDIQTSIWLGVTFVSVGIMFLIPCLIIAKCKKATSLMSLKKNQICDSGKRLNDLETDRNEEWRQVEMVDQTDRQTPEIDNPLEQPSDFKTASNNVENNPLEQLDQLEQLEDIDDSK